jgi:AcrR family transcriptional regulator
LSGTANDRDGGVRERKKQDTRARLIEAAFSLISKRGYDATSIDDIVASVGLSRRTFFRYFSAKEDVLVAWVGTFGEHVCNLFALRPKSEEPLLALQKAFITSVKLYESQYFLSIPLERAIGNNPAIMGKKLLMMKLCGDSMSRALAKRMNTSIDEDCAPAVLAHCVIATMTGAMETWHAQGRKGPMSAALTRAFARVKIQLQPS